MLAAYASFGSLGAQLIATLFVAAMVVPGFLHARSMQAALARVIYVFLMAAGLFAGLQSTLEHEENLVLARITVIGVAAGVAAVVSTAVDRWITAIAPSAGLRTVSQTVLALFLIVIPSALIMVRLPQ